MKYIFELNIKKEDYELLNKYGYHFTKNLEQQVKDVAKEMRYLISVNKNSEK